MGWMGVLINFTDFTHMALLTDVERFRGIYLQKTLPENLFYNLSLSGCFIV